MSKIYIVTDSTADIPKTLDEAGEIIVVPLNVTHGGKTYRDGIDLTVDGLLEILKTSEETPKTSQVNPQSFYNIYSELLKDDCYIISFHLSSQLSGTYQSAVIAKEMLGSDRIFVIDSKSISMGTAFLAIEALRMVRNGQDVHYIVSKVTELSNRVRAIFAVDTLEYLKKGGRVSPAQAAIGTMLNIKPLICMKDGKLEVFDKVRGLKKALKRLVSHMVEDGVDKDMLFAPGHADNNEAMLEFKKMVEEETGITGAYTTFTVGSVVAVYSGPGVVGCNYFVKE
ncbi:MAG: DegV family protein [Pseudomonadota bacterium]